MPASDAAEVRKRLRRIKGSLDEMQTQESRTTESDAVEPQDQAPSLDASLAEAAESHEEADRVG